MARVTTIVGRLARLGFQDPESSARAVQRLDGLLDAADGSDRSLADAFASTADPDQALRFLADLADRVDDRGELLEQLTGSGPLAPRLLRVLGASSALGDHLLRHPMQWSELADPDLERTRPTALELRADLLHGVGADPGEEQPVARIDQSGDGRAVDALRITYRRLLLRLAARDLAGGVGVDDVGAELSDLASGTLEAALAIARARVADASSCRLAVIAMGKCGGRELNYVSDVDVVFVAEPTDGHDESFALRVATALASNLIRICSDHTAEGVIWPVDAALRPEGKAGPLVRTLASHQRYYERWAKTWEFQALLKARPAAGDAALGRDYCASIAPLVWSAADREGFVTDVQAMRRRVVDNIPADQAGRQIKLGSGGLRDVEFAVQLLQLVHGRADESVRSRATLSALSQLTRGGYVGREDGAALDAAYRFLRTLEHRLQLAQLRRVQTMPEDVASQRRLGRAMGFTTDAVAELAEQWKRHKREVRRLHEKLFYRPLLLAVAKLPGEEARLSKDAAEQRLAALGYEDPVAAMRHLEALTSGVSRSAAIQRTLLPVMLGWFAEAPRPDAGLLGFRKISESLGSSHWYLSTLRDEGRIAQRLATVLASSRYATDLLQRAPEGVRILGEEDGLTPRSRDALEREMVAAGRRQEDSVQRITAVRAVRRRELFRLSVADLLGELGPDEVGAALTDLMAATLEAALVVATLAVEAERGEPLPMRMAIVAMGRFGGAELGFGSDADVMFVQEPAEGASTQEASTAAHDVANELRRLLALPGTDPALEVDAGLRPEGKQGPLVRSLESYAGYYARWSAPWEAQALLRADAMIGDRDLCARFTELVDPLRFPATGVTEADIREIRRIKARVDSERLPRGADPATHLKLGRGGLADVEWTVQLLQMRHGGGVPALRTPNTLVALTAAVEAALLTDEDAAALRAAWCAATRLRNAVTLVRGRPSDSLPRDTREKAGVAYVCGYPPGESDALVNDYVRCTRRARRVVDRVFWG
ncbi:MAG: Glutamate-ammonia-ligase adenylyltransferase [uncultured Nocardioidaceae bacterium]|uniref:Bifunctional glutamine synthetase adenylyltransferase/adenylyl-removing enzyme n=1 Tax=uncultured Nocardioidaceae bacterium TaxID=253824 RepID=A0A6J4MI50_9ACTN|nr:MAG: Glutamate-ammonia-ligase adenylyltransferase [uncultured Nocardioidaceae bacterium]